jgi:hypothetical protein
MRLLRWSCQTETVGNSLCHLALCTGEDPAYRYRLTKKLLRENWSSLPEGRALQVADAFIVRAEGSRPACQLQALAARQASLRPEVRDQPGLARAASMGEPQQRSPA